MSRGIDHLVHTVRSLEEAGAFYERLGFTMTPAADHPFGTSNRLAQMDGNFLELLEVSDPEKITEHGEGRYSFSAAARDWVAEREGLSALVLDSTDARADRDAFAAGGIGDWVPLDFSRSATLPDGEVVTVSFSLAFAGAEAMPDTTFFVCQQHTPEYFWKPDYQTHRNGARQISETVFVAADPAPTAAFLASFSDMDPVEIHGGVAELRTSRGKLVVMTPAAYRAHYGIEPAVDAPAGPHIAAYCVEVASLDQTRAVLDTAACRFALSGGALIIPPDAAYGVAIIFRETPAAT